MFEVTSRTLEHTHLLINLIIPFYLQGGRLHFGGRRFCVLESGSRSVEAIAIESTPTVNIRVSATKIDIPRFMVFLLNSIFSLLSSIGLESSNL